MKKVIAIVLACVLLLPVMIIPALAKEVSSIRVNIPSDVAGMTVREFENSIYGSVSIDRFSAHVFQYGHKKSGEEYSGVLEAGQIYYLEINLKAKDDYEFPEHVSLLNVKLETGKGVTVTKIYREKDNEIGIYARLIVDGGSPTTVLKNLFVDFFTRIKRMLNGIIGDIKSIGKDK